MEIFSVSKKKTQFNCTLTPEILYSTVQRSLSRRVEKCTPRTVRVAAGGNGDVTARKTTSNNEWH